MLTFILCSSKCLVIQVWFIFQVYLLVLGWHKRHPYPTRVNNSNISLNTNYASECNSSDYNKGHHNSKWNIFKDRAWMSTDCLLKLMKSVSLENNQNASINGISEFKLDSSFLNSEVAIADYELIRIDCSRWGAWVACYTRESLPYNHQSIFFLRLKAWLQISFCLNQSHLWQACYTDHLTNMDIKSIW